MRQVTTRLVLLVFALLCASPAFAQGQRDGLPDMLIAVPDLDAGKAMPPFVTDSVKRGRVKDIHILFINKRTTALAANRAPMPHVPVVMTFTQAQGCEGGNPFAVTASQPPVLECGVAAQGKDDRTSVRVPVEIAGATWTAKLPLATDGNISSCTLRLTVTRTVAAGGRELRYCFDVSADGVPAADPVIIIRDGGN